MTDETKLPTPEEEVQACPQPEDTSPEAEQTEAQAAAENAPDEQPTGDPVVLLEAAKAKAEAAKAEADKLKDQLLRTAAEYENFRKRSAREQESAFGNGVSHALTQILSILDTLEMAANAPTSDEAYKKGVVMTLEKAASALANLKVEEIPAQGLAFDPQVHSAVLQQAAAEGQESGTVLQVFQKGYKMGDRVIRHATVVVAE